MSGCLPVSVCLFLSLFLFLSFWRSVQVNRIFFKKTQRVSSVAKQEIKTTGAAPMVMSQDYHRRRRALVRKRKKVSRFKETQRVIMVFLQPCPANALHRSSLIFARAKQRSEGKEECLNAFQKKRKSTCSCHSRQSRWRTTRNPGKDNVISHFVHRRTSQPNPKPVPSRHRGPRDKKGDIRCTGSNGDRKRDGW